MNFKKFSSSMFVGEDFSLVFSDRDIFGNSKHLSIGDFFISTLYGLEAKLLLVILSSFGTFKTLTEDVDGAFRIIPVSFLFKKSKNLPSLSGVGGSLESWSFDMISMDSMNLVNFVM